MHDGAGTIDGNSLGTMFLGNNDPGWGSGGCGSLSDDRWRQPNSQECPGYGYNQESVPGGPYPDLDWMCWGCFALAVTDDPDAWIGSYD